MEIIRRSGLRNSLCSSSNWTTLIQTRNARFLPSKKLPTPKTEKRLDIVILGSPNAGKSVLLNTLVQEKLAATTRKRHTTRSEILGVFNHRNVQLAFFDTPGFIRSADATKQDVKALRDLALSATHKADVVLLVVDATLDCGRMRYQETFAEMVQIALDNAKTELILVLNKVDLVFPKSDLLDTTFKLGSLINGVKLGPDGAPDAKLDTTTFMVSAQLDDGVTDLKNYLIAISKNKPWLIGSPETAVNKKTNIITDMTTEQRVEEMILELLMENTHEEIPYIADIKCKTIANLSKTKIKIEVDIRVDSGAQCRIIVGHQGRTLVKIRSGASAALEKILGKVVILYLFIIVRDRTKQDEEER
jgi:GTP-binding protein Era|mmetsp:Transcript_25871/g.24689  ORF Transcript_25871/g.24689 Transcript_25871/m.24689 type:complete len:361 (+) Transcript_25871:140-1222(+)